MTDILCQNNFIVSVRRLGLFELSDNVPQDIPGPYTVTVLFANGQVYEQPFDTSREYPKPDKPLEDCEENSQEWFEWQEYLRYTEATEIHPRKVYEAYCKYCEDVADYIRQNCLVAIVPKWLGWLPIQARCVASKPFRHKLNEITSADWREIHQAAFCPEVTMEDIAAEMRLTFQGAV